MINMAELIGSIIGTIISSVLMFILIGAAATAAESKGYKDSLANALCATGFTSLGLGILSGILGCIVASTGAEDGPVYFISLAVTILESLLSFAFFIITLVTVCIKDKNNNRGSSPKNLKTDTLLCMFLGSIGVHKFYEGKIGLGILYIFTLGLFGIGAFVDLIKLLTGAGTDKMGDSIRTWN